MINKAKFYNILNISVFIQGLQEQMNAVNTVQHCDDGAHLNLLSQNNKNLLWYWVTEVDTKRCPNQSGHESQRNLSALHDSVGQLLCPTPPSSGDERFGKIWSSHQPQVLIWSGQDFSSSGSLGIQGVISGPQRMIESPWDMPLLNWSVGWDLNRALLDSLPEFGRKARHLGSRCRTHVRTRIISKKRNVSGQRLC